MIFLFKTQEEKLFWGKEEDIPLLHKYGSVGNFIVYEKPSDSKAPIRLAVQSNKRGSDSKTIRKLAITMKFDPKNNAYKYGWKEKRDAKIKWHRNLSILINEFKKTFQYPSMKPFNQNKTLVDTTRNQDYSTHIYQNDEIASTLNASEINIDSEICKALKEKFHQSIGNECRGTQI